MIKSPSARRPHVFLHLLLGKVGVHRTGIMKDDVRDNGLRPLLFSVMVD